MAEKTAYRLTGKAQHTFEIPGFGRVTFWRGERVSPLFYEHVAEADRRHFEPARPTVSGALGLQAAGYLLAAGYEAPEEIAGATDDELLAVRGIGPATLAEIHEAYPHSAQSEAEEAGDGQPTTDG